MASHKGADVAPPTIVSVALVGAEQQLEIVDFDDSGLSNDDGPDFRLLAIYFTQVTPTCCGPGLRQTRGAIGVQWSSETRRPRCIQRPPEGRPSSSAGVSSVVGAGPWPGCERAGAGLDGDRNILGLPE